MSRILFAVLALALAFSAQAKGNAANGKELAQVAKDEKSKGKNCATCHGEDGNKPSLPDQPVLAGQHYDYLVRALTDYKNGRRTNGIMKGMAAPLSKQDIEDLAAWFASQTSKLHDQR